MKINHPSDKPVPAAAAAPPVPAKGGQSATAKAAASGGQQTAGVAVTMSTLARTLGANPRGDAADIDAKKVEAVRLALQQGTYQVNAEAIADKLLANAEEMLKRSRD